MSSKSSRPWNERLIPARASLAGPTRLTGRPSSSTDPPLTCWNPVTTAMRVDLPAPWGPMRPTSSPVRSSRFTPASADWDPNRTVTSRSSSVRGCPALAGACRTLKGAYWSAAVAGGRPEDDQPGATGRGDVRQKLAGDASRHPERADYAGRDPPDAADDGEQDDVDVVEDLERAEVDHRKPRLEQRSGQRGDHRRQPERVHLHPGHRDAHCRGGPFVRTHG